MSLRFGTNKIIIHKDYAEILLNDRKRNVSGKTKISLEDVEFVKQFSWCKKDNRGKTCGTIYVVNNKGQYLHRILMNPKAESDIDHRNRNGLDNRRCNLRECSRSINNINSKIRENNTSGITGIGIIKRKNEDRYVVWFGRKYIGTFLELDKAINIRRKFEKESGCL